MGDEGTDRGDELPFLVTVLPLGVSVEVYARETLIEAAWRSGYYWPTICGGRAECRACSVTIESGINHTVPADRVERLRLEMAPPGQTVGPADRLACRLMVNGPVTVRKEGVRTRAPR
jgi:2Fe-2S ferredoxin